MGLLKVDIHIQKQPDDSACGPTSLHAIYKYYNDPVKLDDVLNSVQRLDDGSTLAVLLGIDALKRGFESTLYTYNLDIFDPLWSSLNNKDLIQKLQRQLEYKNEDIFSTLSKAYIEYLKLGGKLLFENLTIDLIKKYLSKKQPIITGLNATYLYETPREYYPEKEKAVYDDVRGKPLGHFVVLSGIEGEKIYVADSYRGNPFNDSKYYIVDATRLLSAILLGVMTYEANLLIVRPKK